MEPVYLDYNATTPIAGQVARAMEPFLREHFGNPSSSHFYGQRTRLAVATARRQLAGLLNCRPEELLFTSCATESNNLAVIGYLSAFFSDPGEIITSAVEHPAVLEVFQYLKTLGFKPRIAPVDSTGRVDPETVGRLITSRTQLISVMHANNEVGTIQPIMEIGSLAREHGVVFHVDAAQSVGKLPVDLSGLPVDLLTVAGHKMYAPKGVGALYVRDGVRICRLMHGAGHENGLRPGTENILCIVGLGAAAQLAVETLDDRIRHLAVMRDMLLSELKKITPGLQVNGHPLHCLPNTLSVAFPGENAFEILSRRPDLAASAGAACHSGDSHGVSHVLKAMGFDPSRAAGTFRFSTGIMTRSQDIHRVVSILSEEFS